MKPPIDVPFITGPLMTATPCTTLPITSGVLVVVIGAAVVVVVSKVGVTVVLTAGTGNSTVAPTPITPHAIRAPEFPVTHTVEHAQQYDSVVHTCHQTVAVVAQSKIIHVLMQDKRSSNDRVAANKTDHIVIREREVRNSVRISNNVPKVSKMAVQHQRQLSRTHAQCHTVLTTVVHHVSCSVD